MSVPGALGVNVTEHVPANRLQLAALRLPAAVVVKLILPVGVVMVPTSVSATVAVHVEATPTNTGVMQVSVVDVARRLTVIVPDPLLVA